MQAKPPLACHANLVAEWGGVAPGGRVEGVKRVGFGGWGADESIMCIQVQRRTTPRITQELEHSRVSTGCRELSSGPVFLFFFLHVSARNTQMHECLCFIVHVCITPSCPLWLSFPHYVKHAKLIELMTSLPTVHRSSLFLSYHLAPLFFTFLPPPPPPQKKWNTKRVQPQYIKDINPCSGLCSIK